MEDALGSKGDKYIHIIIYIYIYIYMYSYRVKQKIAPPVKKLSPGGPAQHRRTLTVPMHNHAFARVPSFDYDRFL